MRIDTRAVALRGLGYGPLGMALLGLVVPPAPVGQPMPGVGGVWPFVYPHTRLLNRTPVGRTRRAREAEFLLMHRL